MTTITVYQSENGEYKGFLCKGHAGYAAYGKDIVCASVSCLTINTINALDELAHENLNVSADEKQGVIDCRFQDSLSEKGTLLMDSLVLGLKNIANEYGKKYLELKFKEV